MPVIDHDGSVSAHRALGHPGAAGPLVGVLGSEGRTGLEERVPLPDWEKPSLEEGLLT